MDHTSFAFAPNHGYFYCTPKRHKWDGLIPELDKFLKDRDVYQMLWATFGPGKENCFFAWKDKDGNTAWCWGDDSPPLLKEWLRDHDQADDYIRVTLGPDGSFFAWDSKRILWDKIPEGLHTSVLGWLGPSGWSQGPPRIVSLGARGSYFALSEYGAVAWEIDSGLKAYASFKNMKEKIAKGEMAYRDLDESSNLSARSISSCDDESFTWFTKSRLFEGEVPDQLDPGCWIWSDYFGDLLEEENAKIWRRIIAEGKAKAEEERQAKSAQQKREQLQREAEDLRLQYVIWRSAWEADLQRKKVLTTFPHLPIRLCICREISCMARKLDTGLLACEHDMEKFLRADEQYSVAWLRKERLVWHPDKFGLRCDPDFRKELKKKATEMYAIFESLITQELGEDPQDGR